METGITLVLQILEGVLPLAASATSGQISNIITIIDKAIPFVAQLGTDLVQPLQNVITALTGNGAVTADQLTALQTQSAALDAALDAQAATDGLT